MDPQAPSGRNLCSRNGRVDYQPHRGGIKSTITRIIVSKYINQLNRLISQLRCFDALVCDVSTKIRQLRCQLGNSKTCCLSNKQDVYKEQPKKGRGEEGKERLSLQVEFFKQLLKGLLVTW